MARLPRFNVIRPGGMYHITCRGNRRQKIYLDDRDRARYLLLLEAVVARFGWRLQAYCLMTNHLHLLVETPEPNLSEGMQLLNGAYAQFFNRRHAYDGHLFQGRYAAEVIKSTMQFCRTARYVVLNPVRAGMCRRPEDWRWSSYRATAGLARCPAFLTVDFLLAQFGFDDATRRAGYIEFVREGMPAPVPQ